MPLACLCPNFVPNPQVWPLGPDLAPPLPSSETSTLLLQDSLSIVWSMTLSPPFLLLCHDNENLNLYHVETQGRNSADMELCPGKYYSVKGDPRSFLIFADRLNPVRRAQQTASPEGRLSFWPQFLVQAGPSGQQQHGCFLFNLHLTDLPVFCVWPSDRFAQLWPKQ